MREYLDNHPAIILTLIAILVVFIIVMGCIRIAKDDTTYNQQFTWAIVHLGNGELIEGHVTSWQDFNKSDMIQITIDDELMIMTHSSNVLLCNEQP